MSGAGTSWSLWVKLPGKEEIELSDIDPTQNINWLKKRLRDDPELPMMRDLKLTDFSLKVNSNHIPLRVVVFEV